MGEAVNERSHFFGQLVKTISFGLTLGVLTAAVIMATELMWQAFAGEVPWSFDAFELQSILIFLLVTLVSGALFAVTMRGRSDLQQLLIGDLIAGAVTGIVTYCLLLISSVMYAETMIDLGLSGAHQTGLAYDVPTFLGPFLTLALTGAIFTSAGAITCRSIIIKKRPTGSDLRNVALGTIGIIALIIVAPPLAGLVLSAI